MEQDAFQSRPVEKGVHFALLVLLDRNLPLFVCFLIVDLALQHVGLEINYSHYAYHFVVLLFVLIVRTAFGGVDLRRFGQFLVLTLVLRLGLSLRLVVVEEALEVEGVAGAAEVLEESGLE